MATTQRYLLTPISFLPRILQNKVQGLNDIIDFGIVAFSKKCNYNLNDASRQVLYDYYTKKGQTSLTKKITQLVRDKVISDDTQYNGFCGKNFDPLVLEELVPILSDDSELSQLIVDHYQLHHANEILKINFSYDAILNRYKELLPTVNAKAPMVSCNVDLLFSFRDEEKTEFEIVQLAAFFAIKSILGEKKYVKTNFKMILCRMMGEASPNSNKIDALPVHLKLLFTKYRKRYHQEKLKEALELNWNIVTYSNHMRGIYCSIEDRMNWNELAIVAEARKMTDRRAKLRFQKSEAKKKAMLLVHSLQFTNTRAKKKGARPLNVKLHKVNK